MKKIKNIFGILVLSAVLGVSNPVAAQTNDNANGTTATTTDDHNDSGKWGLLGLAGLLGLLGLRKKDDNYNNRTTTNR